MGAQQPGNNSRRGLPERAPVREYRGQFKRGVPQALQMKVKGEVQNEEQHRSDQVNFLRGQRGGGRGKVRNTDQARVGDESRVFRSPDHEGGENAYGHQRHEKLICGLAGALKFRQCSKFRHLFWEGSVVKIRAGKLSRDEPQGSGKRSAFQICAFEVSADQACFLQICADEAGVAQVCQQQIRALQVRGVQVRETQADPD